MNSFRPKITFLRALLFLTLGSGIAAGADAQNVAVDSAVTPQDVVDLLEQLESDRYERRQAAFSTLAEYGVTAIPFLVERMLVGPPETAACCGRLLSRIAMNSDQQDMTRIARVFLLLSKNGMQHLGRESIQLNMRWKQGRIDKTVSQLSQVGINAQPTGQLFAQPVPFVSGVIPESESSAIANQTASESESSKEKTPLLQKTNREILQTVNQILQSSEAINNERFMEEMREVANLGDHLHQAAGNSLGEQNARAWIAGDWEVENADHFFSVTIGPDFQGGEDDIKLLRLLPEIAQLTIVGQAIDQSILELLTEDATIQYVSLIQCQYNLNEVFELLEKRPDMLVTSAGNEAFLGVQLQTQVGTDGKSVCQVLEVVAESAAEEAGIQALDVIQSINGTPVTFLEQTILAIGAFKPGDVLALKVKRQDEELEIDVTLRARTPEP